MFSSLLRTAQELFKKYDCTAMAFDPPIPTPKPFDMNKPIKGRHFYLYEDVENAVKDALSSTLRSDGNLLDFYGEFKTNQTITNGISS